mgnify:FL=1
MDISFECNDRLSRKRDALNMMNIVEVMEEREKSYKAFTIALNGTWGSGKTYLVQMWKNWLELENQYNSKTIYFNAWEYDDCESPILPLLYSIISLSENDSDHKFIEQAKFFLKTCGIATIKFGVEKFLGEKVEIANIFNEGIDKLSDEEIKTIFDDYNQYYNRREIMREKLTELIPNHGKLWIFIDELDRCRPDFAVKTMEIIKHFFDITNVVFVFSVDLEQLSKTIQKVYGIGIDTDAYLRKFFDFIYNLTSPDLEKYVSEKNNINSIMSKKTLNYLINLFRQFNFSLRDVDVTLNHVLYFIDRYQDLINETPNRDCALQIYLYFITIKDKFNSEYKKIIHGMFSIENREKNKWNTIDNKFLINNMIKELLIGISEGKADLKTPDLLEKYNLFSISDDKIFSKHLEKILNYSN